MAIFRATGPCLRLIAVGIAYSPPSRAGVRSPVCLSLNKPSSRRGVNTIIPANGVIMRLTGYMLRGGRMFGGAAQTAPALSDGDVQAASGALFSFRGA